MTKILIVDDDLVVLSTITRGLTMHGYTVLQTDEPGRALEICIKEQPDLGILDIRMPEINGIDLAHEIRAKSKTPFIFLSAYNDESTVNAAIAAGALGYLVKPVEVASIAVAIELAIERHQDMVKLASENLNLENAIKNNRDIDVAIGILMSRFALGRAEAFDKLRSYARHQRIKVLDVAKRIVDGELLELS